MIVVAAVAGALAAAAALAAGADGSGAGGEASGARRATPKRMDHRQREIGHSGHKAASASHQMDCHPCRKSRPWDDAYFDAVAVCHHLY